MNGFTGTMDVVSQAFELTGVAVICLGFALAVVRGAKRLAGGDYPAAYEAVRATFGRGVLLGLEVLVAADIIRTVAIDPTLSNLYVLAILVAIRTFLSWSLEVEIDGRWPWQR